MREIARRRRRAQLDLIPTRRDLGDDRGDDGPRRLAGAEGVERAQGDHGQSEAKVIALGERIGPDLGGGIR